jgi:hypothetical protein
LVIGHIGSFAFRVGPNRPPRRIPSALLIGEPGGKRVAPSPWPARLPRSGIKNLPLHKKASRGQLHSPRIIGRPYPKARPAAAFLLRSGVSSLSSAFFKMWKRCWDIQGASAKTTLDESSDFLAPGSQGSDAASTCSCSIETANFRRPLLGPRLAARLLAPIRPVPRLYVSAVAEKDDPNIGRSYPRHCAGGHHPAAARARWGQVAVHAIPPQHASAGFFFGENWQRVTTKPARRRGLQPDAHPRRQREVQLA